MVSCARELAVADGRPKVIAVESSIAAAFVLLAAAAITGPAWLLVLGYAGHGPKDFWQERSHYVAGTRWWPPFCVAVVRKIDASAYRRVARAQRSTDSSLSPPGSVGKARQAAVRHPDFRYGA
jgi:hypothetical protein